jgi:hypothetical protein
MGYMSETIDPEKAKKHYDWRRRINKHVPRLATRVFALRGKSYMGCGYHYAMESRLGKMIARMNDHENVITVLDTILDKLLVEELVRSIVRAEFSARGHDLKKGGIDL